MYELDTYVVRIELSFYFFSLSSHVDNSFNKKKYHLSVGRMSLKYLKVT